MRFERIVRRVCPAAAAALLAAALFLPRPGGAADFDETDLMGRFEKAYTEITNGLLLTPIKEPADEAPFGAIGVQVAKIIETARLLPDLDNYKKDNAFLVFARQLEGRARRLENRIREKNLEASILALSQLQAACLKCHNDYRF